MTELATNSEIETRRDVDADVGERLVTPAELPVLISEQQVLIGSAAALAGPAVRRAGVWARVRVLFAASESSQTSDDRKTPRYYPRRYDFMEHAAMSREMHRL
ncbi:hypothetical protein JDV09_13895 [Mycobacterium sp. Y57]|uniref:hypothetical protein n=1 Tax=Mycolicibacterium xanthum TaxID=2796469 RepID=UPI001C852DEB|nr:hypothetical protein [Mycolicibacterium xanthum]MBX7433193.1 hypothetical protein [Mycolicibacterium xanthum]